MISSPNFSSDADDLDVLHLGVAIEELFDLARIHFLAAADDHVLDALVPLV
jgi:hypothetical protein